MDGSPSRPRHEWQATPLRRHPARQVFERVANVAEDKTNLGRVGFVRGFAEISVKGIEQSGFAGFDGNLQPPELVLPVVQRARGNSLEILALPCDEWRAVHNQIGEVSASEYKFVKS
jgi:hypothetical protein